ncbi:hypothetical protein [Dickeya sp. NCPPB 3274]|uniref:hypothetical protein n=1 Tax=Dickeya sp. NCPPB 3274 TaxID=568766 RepID=UPI0005B41F76|nr:hypothetical protein [Dickeya sp. NCPPB 3274]
MKELDVTSERLECDIKKLNDLKNAYHEKIEEIRSLFDKDLREAHFDVIKSKGKYELACIKSWGGEFRRHKRERILERTPS